MPVVFWDIELLATFYWDSLYVCNNYARSQPIHLSTGELGWPDKICGNLWQSHPCPCYCHGSLGKPAITNKFSSVATHMEVRNISTNKFIWYNWLNWHYLLKWFKLEFSQFENHWMWIASCSCHIVDNLWKKLFSQILQVIWFWPLALAQSIINRSDELLTYIYLWTKKELQMKTSHKKPN